MTMYLYLWLVDSIFWGEVVQGSSWKGEFEDVKVERKFREVSPSLTILTPDSFKTCICLKATTVFICVPAQSALGIVEIQVSFKIGTIALISVLLDVVL